jgi:hypothetical protein
VKRVAIALVVLLALTGCAETGSLIDKAQIDLGLQGLTDSLSELGVDTEYTAELTADYHYIVSVNATSGPLLEQDVIDVAVLVRQELGSGVFERTVANFSLTTPDGTVLGISDFSMTEEQLAGDVAYAFAVAEAYGAPASVFFGRTELGDYMRSVGVLDVVASPDWDAIRAVPDTTDAQPSWGFPGISATGELPPPEITDLVDAINAATPLLAQPDSGAFMYLDWYPRTGSAALVASDLDPVSPTASAYWPTYVTVAGLIDASPVDGLSFALYGNGTNLGMATAHFGACAEAVPADDFDTAIVAALMAAGVSGAQPGQCLEV